jgi:hypothetical protein
MEIKSSSTTKITADEDVIKNTILAVIQKNIEEEAKLDELVDGMMDQLERQNADFQRYKMFPLLKKKLAEQRGFVL